MKKRVDPDTKENHLTRFGGARVAAPTRSFQLNLTLLSTATQFSFTEFELCNFDYQHHSKPSTHKLRISQLDFSCSNWIGYSQISLERQELIPNSLSWAALNLRSLSSSWYLTPCEEEISPFSHQHNAPSHNATSEIHLFTAKRRFYCTLCTYGGRYARRANS